MRLIMGYYGKTISFADFKECFDRIVLRDSDD